MGHELGTALGLALAGAPVAAIAGMLASAVAGKRGGCAARGRRAAIEHGFVRRERLVVLRAGGRAAEGERPEPVGDAGPRRRAALAPLRDAFLAAGLDELGALEAAERGIDPAAFRRLVGRGCPPPLALRILA